MAGESPTARSLAHCKGLGWVAEVVEKWLPIRRPVKGKPGQFELVPYGVRKDFLGCMDILALDDQVGVLGIQASTSDNASARIRKALSVEHLPTWLEFGNRFEVWGWGLRGDAGRRKLWTLRRVSIRLDPAGAMYTETLKEK